MSPRLLDPDLLDRLRLDFRALPFGKFGICRCCGANAYVRGHRTNAMRCEPCFLERRTR